MTKKVDDFLPEVFESWFPFQNAIFVQRLPGCKKLERHILWTVYDKFFLLQENGTPTPGASKITKMVGVAKKKEDPTKKKGELMESNMDAMEVCWCLISLHSFSNKERAFFFMRVFWMLFSH